MEQLSSEALAVLKVFHRATGFGVFFYDRQAELAACVPEDMATYEATFLSIKRVTDSIRRIFAESDGSAASRRQYHTLVTGLNFFVNIVPVYGGGEIAGALVTEPVLVKKLTREEMWKVLDEAGLLPAERKAVEKALRETPVVPYEKIMPAGRVLYGLAQFFFKEDEPLQVMHRGNPDAGPGTRHPRPKQSDELPKMPRHFPFPTFMTIRDTIRNGDTAALLDAMDSISAGDIPMDQLNRLDFVRSVKDSLIKACAMGCYAAVDGGASYEHAMDLLDDFVRRAEMLSNIYDIYELMKNAMLSFSRAVTMGGPVYTKPVSRAMEYIEKHYAEKITLGRLGEYTGLSTFYLSSLIGKETGRTLADNVNKVRVEKSMRLLRDKNRTALEVAREVGFSHENQYSAAFKKFVGTTPGRFRRAPAVAGSSSARRFRELPQLTYNQLGYLLKTLPGLIDIARIVDPERHRCWLIGEGEKPERLEACYRFWKREEACENCISKRAFLTDDTVFKVEPGEESDYLVLAVPRHVGEKVYVVELLKKLPGRVVIHGDGAEADQA